MADAATLQMLIDEAGALRNQARTAPDREDLLARARTRIDQGIRIATDEEGEALNVGQVADLFFLAGIIYYDSSTRPGPDGAPVSGAVASEDVVKAMRMFSTSLELKQRHGIAADVDQIRSGLSQIAKTQSFVRQLGLPADRVIETLKAARHAFVVLDDVPPLAFATLELAHAYADTGEREEAERILREFLELDPPSELREDALSTLADVLSQMGRFEEAAEIQKGLLGDDV